MTLGKALRSVLAPVRDWTSMRDRIRSDADWDESQHERDESGRFTSGGGGGGDSKKTVLPRRLPKDAVPAAKEPGPLHDDPMIQRAADMANRKAAEWQEKFTPLGVKVVMGGSLISGMAIPTETQDMDIRLLYDGDIEEIIPKVEEITGLKFHKKSTAGGGDEPITNTAHIRGMFNEPGVKVEADAQIRTSKGYRGWASQAPEVLSKDELREVRRRKLELWREAERMEAATDDEDEKSAAWKPYKAYKQEVLKVVQERVKRRGGDEFAAHSRKEADRLRASADDNEKAGAPPRVVSFLRQRAAAHDADGRRSDGASMTTLGKNHLGPPVYDEVREPEPPRALGTVGVKDWRRLRSDATHAHYPGEFEGEEKPGGGSTAKAPGDNAATRTPGPADPILGGVKQSTYVKDVQAMSPERRAAAIEALKKQVKSALRRGIDSRDLERQLAVTSIIHKGGTLSKTQTRQVAKEQAAKPIYPSPMSSSQRKAASLKVAEEAKNTGADPAKIGAKYGLTPEEAEAAVKFHSQSYESRGEATARRARAMGPVSSPKPTKFRRQMSPEEKASRLANARDARARRKAGRTDSSDMPWVDQLADVISVAATLDADGRAVLRRRMDAVIGEGGNLGFRGNATGLSEADREAEQECPECGSTTGVHEVDCSQYVDPEAEKSPQDPVAEEIAGKVMSGEEVDAPEEVLPEDAAPLEEGEEPLPDDAAVPPDDEAAMDELEPENEPLVEEVEGEEPLPDDEVDGEPVDLGEEEPLEGEEEPLEGEEEPLEGEEEPLFEGEGEPIEEPPPPRPSDLPPLPPGPGASPSGRREQALLAENAELRAAVAKQRATYSPKARAIVEENDRLRAELARTDSIPPKWLRKKIKQTTKGTPDLPHVDNECDECGGEDGEHDEDCSQYDGKQRTDESMRTELRLRRPDMQTAGVKHGVLRAMLKQVRRFDAKPKRTDALGDDERGREPRGRFVQETDPNSPTGARMMSGYEHAHERLAARGIKVGCIACDKKGRQLGRVTHIGPRARRLKVGGQVLAASEVLRGEEAGR